MTVWIGLFHGINVGGKNRLPMADLKGEIASLGFKNVRTYIQSGNVVFDSLDQTASSITQQIISLVEKQHGFRPQLILLTPDNLLDAIQSNPFPEAVSEPKTLHFFFLAEPAKTPNREAIDNAQKSTEHYQLTDAVFYLHAPDGIGRSKLAANVEKYLGVPVTARNYRTVDKVRAMLPG